MNMNYGCASLGLIVLSLCIPVPAFALTDEDFQDAASGIFDPVMQEHDIPGLAIGVTMGGKHYVHVSGMADQEAGRPVDQDTVFELGSISKLFNVTLAALADQRGVLSLADPVSDHSPALQGTAFGRLSLMDLATHQSGGMPLQVPDEISDNAGLIDWLAEWRPEAGAGHDRSYSNISIGVLGRLVAMAFGQDFPTALQENVLAPLGLEATYIVVPQEAQGDYAFGYSKDTNMPIRVNPGMLDAEAYGVKSSVTDMLTYLDAQLGQGQVPQDLAQAIQATQAGQTQTAHFQQAMIWERYGWPADLNRLLAGNDSSMALESQPADRLDSPDTKSDGVLLSKTGSTSGFGGYVALIPEEDFGIVILANRNYPNQVRVEAGIALAQRLIEGATAQ
ncbi:beta-lactamase [Paracoccus caeni]|uniref:Beta-lactamase n=1 Tax=Paracoccus caeni TaxID=657651 RepID=A0A934SFL2_9RHOB|nr:class C beta-lactamase [Paracoccus caeni]MBK4216504.1 beta-lactamase [Paracoccus caeni]